MQMKPVNSSNVAKIGYDPERRVLRAQYKSGGTHDYDGVPADAYAELMDGRSVGGYIASEIKPRFAGRKVEEAPQPIRDTGSAPISHTEDPLESAIRQFNTPPERP